MMTILTLHSSSKKNANPTFVMRDWKITFATQIFISEAISLGFGERGHMYTWRHSPLNL